MEHPYYQRLRHIQQLGLTSYVYPGALHTRFHHALGAMHLMQQAIKVLRSKNVPITDDEALAVTIAILLHDIGHGPFSHALEHSLVSNISHETISELFMEHLNQVFEGKLTLAIEIFKGKYHKDFLHELVSSQLDMDRLDYLNRDSFFTGVQEGIVGCERIIKMLDVRHNRLVVEVKGIYSIEKFIVARRLMYWQVYLHKTVLSAEMMLVKVLQRAKELAGNGHDLFATPALQFFLKNEVTEDDFTTEILDKFAQLGDTDIITSLKVWQDYEGDVVLSELSRRIIQRKLLKIKLSDKKIKRKTYEKQLAIAMAHYKITEAEAAYLVFRDKTSNRAYTDDKEHQITILYRNGKTKDIAKASDHLNIKALSESVVKHFMCYVRVD